MSLDHEAIRKAYSTVVSIDDGAGAFDKDGKSVVIDDSLVNGSTTYDTIGNQLGMLYDDIIAGKLDATGSFAIHNKAVKDANPKPS